MTNENSTLVHEGITYRKVNRKASVGEKVLVVSAGFTFGDYKNGDILTVEEVEETGVTVEDYGSEKGEVLRYMVDAEYVVLEPVEESLELTELTESDVRNNPRQVIDLLGNLALRLTQSERLIEELTDKLDRLASANEQAVNLVARNVETWAQETESLKHDLAKVNERTQPYQVAHDIFVKIAGRQLTDEERREL